MDATARLAALLREGKRIRSIGFDDGPFQREPKGARVPIAGVVCSGTRFEGMVWGSVEKDGFDAGSQTTRLLLGRKFLPQLHLVLLDGIAFGGFNVVDLPGLAEELSVPCLALMRRAPDLGAVIGAIGRLDRSEERLKVLRRAGPIFQERPFVYQAAGIEPKVAREALCALTDTGHVPEPLRLAHLVARALLTGESGRRA